MPARNTVFLSLALAWAEVLDARHIYIGVNAVDYSGYPDCRDATIQTLAQAVSLGMDQEFKFVTPLMRLDKAATWALGEEIGGEAFTEIVREYSHSCYMGARDQRHDWGYGCGQCPACQLRAKGHAAWRANIPA
ncbi:MAG TPA: hypothetical protein DCO82_03620 [Alphaproteobacteria bacterium]|nr:hypothetical protein [Alphaproteobacteria bacterium]